MSPKGIKDIKGLHAIKGIGSINIRSGLSAASKKDAKHFQLDIEKDNLMKLLEQFERQKTQIEKRLAEIAQIVQSETHQPEEQPKRETQEEKSSVLEEDVAQNKQGEFDFRIGKISFNDVIQGIGSFIDLVATMEAAGKEEEKREGEFISPSGRVKAVYGLSIKEGLGGKPIVEPFGNVKKGAQGPVVEEEREPLADIFDEKDHISVIVELPGVQVKDIHIEVKGDILTLSAVSSNRKYYKELVLPRNADASTLERKYKNGILEIRMYTK